jgi:hypothetical protein
LPTIPLNIVAVSKKVSSVYNEAGPLLPFRGLGLGPSDGNSYYFEKKENFLSIKIQIMLMY